MGRKGPRAKTKIVLKSVKQWEQLGNMHNLKRQTFLNTNHPNVWWVGLNLFLKKLFFGTPYSASKKGVYIFIAMFEIVHPTIEKC